jgi:hypothetical protein
VRKRLLNCGFLILDNATSRRVSSSIQINVVPC